MVPSSVALGLLLVLGGVAFWAYRRFVLAPWQKSQADRSRRLAAFSHDIRSPLNAIYGYAQLLERGGHIAPLEAARVIRRSCEQLTGLVEDLQEESAPGFNLRRGGDDGGAAVGYEGARHSILLIDDDKDQLALLRSFLEPLGFVVHAAPDGAAGLAMAREHWPDLVLLDVSMPGLSGWEVASGLRAMLGGALRIIMVSGDVDQADVDAHDLFLQKPIDLDALMKAVGEVLQLPQKVERQGALPDHATRYLDEIEAELRIGHVRGIAQSIHALGDAVPQAAGEVPGLMALLERCDMAGLGAAVKSLR